MSKTLVAYMSVSGQTRCLAKSLAEAAQNANLYEIKPKAPYTSDDLNYRNKESRCTIEMTVPGWRPELSEIIDTSAYDTIFVGFPIWWGKAPTLVNSFLESIDTKGKRIALFATSGGSPVTLSWRFLKDSAPEAEFIGQKRFDPHASVEDLKTWLEEIGY